MDIYKAAAQKRLRFPILKGLCNVEDLYDLPLTQLDATAKQINTLLKDEQEESFISKSKRSTDNQLRLDIVKDVIAYRLAEQEARENRAAKKIQKDKLLAALARKEDAALEDMSAEEIKAQLDAL